MGFVEWKADDVLPCGPGIYILHACGLEIPGPYGIDKKGILYIGKSGNLKKRLRVSPSNKDFVKDYSKNPKLTFNHSSLTFTTDFEGGPPFKLILHSPCIVDGYCGDLGGYLKKDTPIRLYYSFTDLDKEKDLLQAHVVKYGQLPPFNFTGPSLKEVWNTDKSWDEAVEKYNRIMSDLNGCELPPLQLKSLF